jgi:hypothetical protein
MKLLFVTSRNFHPNTLAVLYPLIFWRRELKMNGIDFDITFDVNNITNTDIIILDSKYHRDLWNNNTNRILNDFYLLKKKSNKFIYFDTTDSTSSIQREVFDYVNRYWKMQIFSDKNNYMKSFFGGRIFTDFLKNLDVVDSNLNNLNNNPLRNEWLSKIDLAWNTSFSRYDFFGTLYNKYFVKLGFLPNLRRMKLNIDYKSKDLFLFSKFGANYSRKTISYQRKLIISKLNLKNQKKIGKFDYFKQLTKSKYCISPFGWGEIAYRDFEAISKGCVLIKPDMDHLETWPNYYQKWKTYIPLKWDISDLDEVIIKCNLQYNDFKNYADNAIQIYDKHLFSLEASNLFIQRLKFLIKKE